MTQWIESGNPRSPLWLVGEAPGEYEIADGRPFTGLSGRELDKMLQEAGLSRADCFATNVCHVRPPTYIKNGKEVRNDIDQFFAGKLDARKSGLAEVNGRYPKAPITEGLARLREQIDRHQPRLILALGNTPMWGLCGQMGITKWRGSILADGHAPVIPTFHPADILRQITHRPIAVQDFRRARKELESPTPPPRWEFVTAPTRDEVLAWFATYASDASRPLVCDTEGWGRVDCIGFAADRTHAICIPFKHETGPDTQYWSEEDEYTITQACRTVLASRPIIFHNALWDCQVIAKCWGMMPLLHGDTQVAQHTAFPGLLGGRIDPVTGEVDKKGSSLSLSFIASMYCEYYRYWKDDGRHFDPAIGDESTFWRYNCEDCVRTYECWEVLTETLASLNLTAQYEFELSLFAPVFSMMFRGIRYDRDAARRDRADLVRERDAARAWLATAVGCDFNPDSSPQMRALFHDDLAMQKFVNRKTGAPTLDDATLDTYARRTPLLRPLIKQIQNYRTLDTLRGTLDTTISPDGRFRTALNVAFVETFRFSSNETAFGEGSNLQNIKRPDED